MFWILNLLLFLTSSLPSPSSDLKVPNRELRWRRQRKRHFEKAFAFFQTLSRLFQSAENVKCRQVSLELISWGPQSNLEGERKILRHLFTSSIKREIRHFHVIVAQRYKKAYCTCEVVFLLNKPIALLEFLIVVAVVVAKAP